MNTLRLKTFDEVLIGDKLPEAQYSPTSLHANLMNIANWGTHRIHYDKGWAQHDGFTDIVVQGALLYAFVEKMLVEWVGDPAAIRQLSFRNVAVPLVGHHFKVFGAVCAKQSNNEVRCEFCVANSVNEKVVVGDAVIRLE